MKKIKKNVIRCKHCGNIIESTGVHDFKFCECKTCAVDGGHDYLRRCYKTNPETDFEDLSEIIEVSDEGKSHCKQSDTKILDEIALFGGRSTQGVVRIDNTVRRPHKKESEFANSFLSFLQENGFEYSQRYLGQDESGRDIFEYIEGFVPDDIGNTTLDQLCEFMKIVRRFHDLSLRFTRKNQVICHNDLSPCNTVFVDNMPVAIIDWDSACVGERWEDLTYILWLWINIGSHDRANIDILGQTKAALFAYGADAQTLKNFSGKLIWRMNKVIAEMSPNNYQYEKTKDWVEFSKLWVEQNSEIITKEIG